MKLLSIILFLLPFVVSAQEKYISTQWDELTSSDFVKAVNQSGKVCILPLGIIEKHGPSLPLSTDLITIRGIASGAAKQEYVVVFPPYYIGQINEARHLPGTISYSPDLIWKMLEETCDEIARNGFEKIILVNGHGGNNYLVNYFCQAQLAKRKTYAIYLYQPQPDSLLHAKVEKLLKQLPTGSAGHAGANEASYILALRPELVKIEVSGDETGRDQDKLKDLPDVYTGIWWYAKFPNHFASDVNPTNKRLGELLVKSDAEELAELIKYLKTDKTIQQLQEEFFKKASNPSGR